LLRGFTFRLIISRIIAWLGRMATGLGLLVALGVASILGTLIPQGEAAEFYLHNYGLWGGKLILGLSLDNLYYAVWFIAMGVLLALSLCSCIGTRWRRWGYAGFPAGSLFIHLGLVVLLVASAWSLLGNRSTQVNLAPGQTVNLAELGMGQGQLTLQDFAIDYYPDGSPQQYRSRLLWHGEKGQRKQKTIMVNHPLSVGGVKIYQASYGWLCNFSLSEANGFSTALQIEEGQAIT